MVCLKIDSALKKCGSSCNVKTFLLHFVTVPPLVIRFIHMRNPPPRTGKSASRCGLEPFVAARRTTRQQSGRRQGRLEANLCKAWQGSKALPCKGGRCGRREMFKHMIYIYIYGVSKNRGVSPQIINFNRVFHYKPSILGYHYFWKHPYIYTVYKLAISIFKIALK